MSDPQDTDPSCPECDPEDGPCAEHGRYCPGCGGDDGECVCCDGCRALGAGGDS